MGILATSMSAILVRWADAPATVNGFYRMTTAAILMSIPLVVQAKRQPLVFDRSVDSGLRRALAFAALGGVFFALNLSAWNTGALVTSAANVSLLGNTTVIWVPLAGMLFFKVHLRPAFWLGLVLALSGAFVILGRDLVAHPTLGIGDSFALLASLFYTGYMLIMERVRAMLSTLISWWVSTVASALTMLLLTLALREPLAGYAWTSYAIFIVTALVIQIGGFLSLSYALGHLPASLVSITLLIQPVITAFLAIPLLGQAIAPIQAFGSGLVLTGIVIAHRSRL
jgi:drug/metabolite transporter (DMT)-like permease